MHHDAFEILAIGADRDHFGPHPVHPDSLVAILAKDERLAVLKDQLMLGLDALVAHVVECAIVEDIAVLENLDERRAAMVMCALEGVAEMFLLDVDGTRNESSMRAKRHGDRVEWEIHRSRR